MAALRLHSVEDSTPVLRFPVEEVRKRHAPQVKCDASCSPHSANAADMVLDALDTVDRRIEHLARELNCLGHFDDDNDHRPRAA